MPNVVLSKVLEPSELYEYRPDVIQLAQALQAITDDAAAKSADVASTLFKVAYSIDLDSQTLKEAVGPLADVLDQIELAVDKIISTVANRREAFIKPPPGNAEVATISVKTIAEQRT